MIEKLNHRSNQWCLTVLTTASILLGITVSVFDNYAVVLVSGALLTLIMLFAFLVLAKLSLVDLLLIAYMITLPFGQLSSTRIQLASGVSIPLQFVFLPFLFAVYILQVLCKKQRLMKRDLIQKEMRWLIFIGVASILSYLFSPMRGHPGSLMTTIEICIYLGLYFVLARLIQSKKTYRWIFWAFTLSATALLMFFFTQGLRGRLGLRSEYGLGPNKLALILEVAFFSYMGYLFSSKDSRVWFYLLGCLLTGLGLILTFSRGAWISTALGVLLIIGYAIRKSRVLNILILLLVSSLPLLVLIGIIISRYDPHMQIIAQIVRENVDRFFASNYMRLTVYRKYFSEVLKSPIFGVGFAGDLEIPFNTRSGNIIFLTRTAHNSYLHLLYKGGGLVFIGMLSFLFIHGHFLVRLRSILNRLEGYLGNILVVTYLVILFHMMVESFILSSIFWGIMSLQGAALNLAADQDKLNLKVDNATIA